ncbi:uncharacterized protein LOC128744450 [Sabethes cyaneus]|uniref:uncharacterized protein LOC128744450 n=1 Tax=Sabethes cyaneus TaxID=53552 RepID=UPI00237E34F8|nr:uncharacterized protein LOC128744450 [Sabethes cyaneus]XP_053697454.1 uncharacterized protein LOC128744450 [Sabethes cyaneus]
MSTVKFRMEILKYAFALLVLLVNCTNRIGAERRNRLIDPRICGRPYCSETNNKFSYQRNHLYKYDYSMYVKTEFSGSGENSSELHLIASVEIDFPKPCQGIMKLYSIEVRDRPLPVTEEQDFEYGADYVESPPEVELHPKSELISEELQRFELKFAFHDGLVSEICHESDEPVWTLNLKRGILSSFQNSMPRFDIDFHTRETDVSGVCDVTYTMSGTKETSLLLTKTKDITSCKNRYKTNSLIQSVPYDFRPNYVAWPILNSTSYCNISVDNYIYKEAICYERHQLVPFSNDRAGAVTESYSKLVLADEESYTPEEHNIDDDYEIQKRSTLIYDHTPSVRDSNDEIKASRELLKDLCRLGFPDIKRSFPDVFLHFLSTARMLSFTALSQLLYRSKSICENGKNHVLESLPYIGSPASVTLMKDQIIKEQIPADLAKKWMESFAYLTRPDEEVLEAMLELLEYGKENGEKSYILSATSVVHTFCAVHADCTNNDAVQSIVQFLETDLLEKLHNGPNLSRKLRENIIILLKGLGNTGVINTPFYHELREIIENDKLPMEIRLQAVYTYRRHDCVRSKDYFLKLFSNFEIDVEIRIAAYKQAMRCPDYLSVKLIKHVLKIEEVNQVGSYVWSHLTNLASSASPVRVEAQGLLADNDLGKKFRMDIRKFSRNYEETLFFDEYNFGLTTDADVIFSADSYLPRTGSLNLTADLFGESINFLELNARAEGFEYLVESIFGPTGPLNSKKVKEYASAVSSLFSSEEEDDEQVGYDPLSQFRIKRHLNSSTNTGRSKRQEARSPVVISRDVHDKIDSMGYRMKSDFKDPHATLGVKIFGNDLKYYTIEGFAETVMAAEKINPVNMLKEMLSGKELSYTKSGVFLDASYDVPLSTGLPLALSVIGASSIDLRMSGSFKVVDFWKSTRHIDVEGKVKPGVSIDITAIMKSDLVHAATGIKLKSNLYSSSALEAKGKVRGDRLVSLQFSLPQDHNEIFSARSELLVFDDSRELKQKGIASRYANSTCTWPVVDRAIGIKLCADYSLPDVSNNDEVPSLILSGPVQIDISLQKADPTAKVFLFQYTWDTHENTSTGSLIFETPNSQIPRIFIANITSDLEGYSVSMGFRNGDISHSAVGIYQNNKNLRRLDMSLNVNDRKYLALEMGYNKTEIKYGMIYNPSLFLSVNNERIAGMAGQIKMTDKKGIKQWDLNLQFETKRVQTKVIGFIQQTQASITTKFSMDYRFINGQPERLTLGGTFADRSNRGRTEYHGSFELRSTAYPNFDFATTLKFLSALGHVECKLEYNNAVDLKDPFYTTTLQLIFARFHVSETGRTTASVELTRPRSRMNLKAMIKHEHNSNKGTEHNVLVLLRYAKDKDITAVFSVYMPRTVLFAIDTAANITVPGFDSCTVNFKMKEKARKEYYFDFNGMWFSGHSIAINGWYQDRSSFIKTYYHAKLEAKSPSFGEATADLKYVRDEIEYKLEMHAEYAKQSYGLTVRHVRESEDGTNTYAGFQWRESLYSFSAVMKSAPIKVLILELHIDKLRDISVTLKGYTTDVKREVGVEVKWDANRDPTQKLVISGEISTPKYRIYNGQFIVSYPNRTVSGIFDLKAIDPVYLANARISWNTTEAIELKLDAGSDEEILRNMWLLFKLTTPFEGWRYNALNGGFYLKDNLLKTNITAKWAEDQTLGFEVMGLYLSNDTDFNCELKTKLHSSIEHVPTVKVHLKHKYDIKRIDTVVTVNHTVTDEPPQVFSVRSVWQYDHDENYRNVSGSLACVSPFEGYKTGALSTKFSLSESRELRGAADLQLDDEKYDLVLKGHVRNLVDNMLTVNITSSNEKFRNIRGIFGISEKERHAVAEVKTPKSALGIEVLFAVVTAYDFDIKFYLATPLKDLEKVILRGKLKKDNVDFRAGLNNLIIGFLGVWRKAHLKDFEYSYKVFTPLPKFEENGLILKLITDKQKSEYINLEFSGRFSQYKLGLKAVSEPKPQLMRQLGVQKASELLDEFIGESDTAQSADYEEEEEDDTEDEEDLLNLIGKFELDTIVWPTLTGTLDLEEYKSKYYVTGKLKLPQGYIDIRDRFWLEDLMNMKNVLKVKTPFPLVTELQSEFELGIPYPTTKFVVGFNVLILNVTEWVNTGFHIYYNVTEDDTDAKIHHAIVNLMTPLENLKKVRLHGVLEVEEHGYKGNLTAKTMTTEGSIALMFETEDQYIDSALTIWVRAPILPYYACRVFYKQDLAGADNAMNMGFVVHDGELYNNFRLDGAWSTAEPHFLVGKGKYQSNFLPVNMIDTEFVLTRQPYPKAQFELRFNDSDGVTELVRAKATRNREMVAIELSIPLEEYRNLTIYGSVMKKDGDEYSVLGQLYRNEEVFNIDGDATIVRDIPKKVSLVIRPIGEGEEGSITYEYNTDDTKTAFNAKIERGERHASLDGSLRLMSMADWNFGLDVQSSDPNLEGIDLKVGIRPLENNLAAGSFKFKSPWKRYGIEEADINMLFDVKPISGTVTANYTIPSVSGDASCLWNWHLLENMQFALHNRVLKDTTERYFEAGVRYLSPDIKGNHNMTFGGDLNLNNIWIFSTNASVTFISISDLAGVLKVRLPKPVGDVHTLAASMNGNIPFLEPVRTFNFETFYETEESRKRYAWHSEYSFVNDLRTLLRFEWGPDVRSERIQSNLDVFQNGAKHEISAKLRGPWYLEDAFRAIAVYDLVDGLYLVNGNVSIPASNKVSEANVAFVNLSNMKGDINCTTPFLNITWLHGQLEFIESPLESIRYLKAAWPESNAIFDSKTTYKSHNLDRDQQGTIKVEIPLQTRHYAEVKYGLAERPAITTGHAEIEYNNQKVLSGQYTSKQESRAGFEKETVDVTLENNFKPVGVHYVHTTRLLKDNYKEMDIKRAEVFELRNQKKFNITGELQVTTRDTGREYVITAIHPNRTVVLSADFDEDGDTTKQKSKLQLSPKQWIAYDFHLTNLSKPENVSQKFWLKISYPRRNLTAEGWYAVTDNSFDSDVSLQYTPNKTNDKDIADSRILRGVVRWIDDSAGAFSKQTVLILLGHPTFEQDITMKGVYYSDDRNLLKTNVDIEYTQAANQHISFAFDAKDLTSLVGYRNYSYTLSGLHEASDLDLNSQGSVGLRLGLYELDSRSYYKRGYLSRIDGYVIGKVDVKQKELLLEKITSHSKYRMWTKASGGYPLYMINGSLLDGPELDSTGFFYIDIDNKLVHMKINMTPDASENVYMYGIIPDSRSAYFDFWRDYDTLREVDVALYTKMNHSRLVTSKLHWRPEIRNDLRNLVRNYVTSLHNSFTESMEFWIKQIYLESKDSVNGIWDSAHPFIEGFLEDVSGLNVIQDDLENLRRFLNESYVADDFYVRSVINFTITVLDELAIKNKLTSFPKILTEFWQVMGESGQALKKSLTWLMETIKASYQRVVDVIGRILQGDSMQYLSEVLETSVARYDKFIKDLHLQFIKNVQEIWNKLSETITSYWQRMLQNIEPSVIKLAHYAESMTWHVGHEVFSFLYNKTQEIAESPYFTKVSNFTQDLDTLYKDLIHNDIITNAKKYGSIVIRFVQEKFFRLVPFGRELHQVFTELWDEIKQLQNLEYVQFILQRVNEVRSKAEWLAEEFQLEKRVRQLWRMVRNKLTRYAQTALQAENQYREAKTMFIFDPDQGILELEQKLPMSWHAFNETPKFDEIPEYKFITDVQDFFAGSNTTVWTLYYALKPYTDTKMWLPPFKSNSLLVGSRHYMSFDKRFVSMELRDYRVSSEADKCSYVLAHDFYNKTFTLLLEPTLIDGRNSQKIVLLTENNLLEIDFSDMSVQINRNVTTALPAQIADTVVYRETDYLAIQSVNGFKLTCSLQYNLCSFDLTGWYFGKTAGILGTMNNEAFDDYITSEQKYTPSNKHFINSWKLPGCDVELDATNHTQNYLTVSSELSQICESFFQHKHSYFASCFSVVDTNPFFEMCLDLGQHLVSRPNEPSNNGACTSALAYMEACLLEDVPLRVPDSCIYCQLMNGSYVPEGTFVSMKDKEIPQTADVVFIVEAKECNRNITTAKSIITMVQSLHKEFLERNITNNRYSVVSFGGESPFDKPRSVIVNDNVFVSHEFIEPFFNHIAAGEGTNDDIFEAITVASKLVFRPGVSKTFILLPCSKCASSSMKLDYSSLLQLLLENGIKLHILADHDIESDKSRVSQMFFGMDRDKAYTKKDIKELAGDVHLRKQVRLPKATLGSCAALALETDGSVFSGRKLRPERRNLTKKFITVFTKRVALTASAVSCQTCECTGHNTGVSYMLCLPCTYPSAFSLDQERMTEDELLSVLQPDHDWDWEEDDELL